MKKLIAITMIVLMSLALSACSKPAAPTATPAPTVEAADVPAADANAPLA